MVDPNTNGQQTYIPVTFFADSPNIAGNCRPLFEKIYDGEPILTVFSVFGEDLHHRCFNSVYYVRTTSQPNANAVFANNYLSVLYSNIRNRAVLGLSQVGSCTDICKNLSGKIKVKPIKRFLFCLGCSYLPSTKYLFPHRTLFQFLCPHRPSKLGRQPCWVAYLLVCVPGPVR
jgi:hypothetical protein